MKLQSNKKRNTIIIISVILAVVVLAAVVGLILIFGDQPEKKNPQDIVGISLVSKPSKITYYVGEEFDPAGTKIQVGTHDMAYSSFVEYGSLTFSGFDSSAPVEEQVITVSYKGFTTTFTVEIKEIPSADPILTSIRLSDNFVSTYTLDWWKVYGPVFDGVDLICTYSDGSEKSVPMSASYCLTINLDVNGATTVEIPVEYSDAGIIATTIITVTITN